MQGVLLMQIPYRCDGKGIGTWHTACKQATHRNVHQQGVPALHPQAKAVLFTFRELLSGSDWQGVRVKCACQVCDGAERCAERCALVSREVVSFFLRSDGHLLHIALEKQGLFLKSYPLCVST